MTVLFLLGVLAQIQMAPPVSEIPSGTSSIEGIVENEATHAPIGRAEVHLNGPFQLDALSDGSGRFAFRQLPEGTYFVNVQKQGYQQGGDGMFVQSPQINLKAGESNHDLRVTLSSGGEVSGRVVNDRGEPLANCFVGLFKREMRNGQAVMEPRGGDQTRANGEYSVTGVAAGSYYARAQCGNWVDGAHQLLPPGDPLIPHDIYNPAFSGGGASPDSAQKIVIDGSAPVSGVNFELHRLRAQPVSGSVASLDPDMPMGNIMVSLMPRDSEPVAAGQPGAAVEQSTRKFSIPAVTPGAYRLIATIGTGDRVWFASQDITVASEPVEGIRLTLTRGFDMKGTAEMADGSPVPAGTQVSLQPGRSSGSARGMMSWERSTTQPVTDGAFQLPSLLPGHYRLMTFGPNGYLKTVFLDGQEVDRTDISLASGGTLRIVLGAAMAQLDVAVEGAEPGAQSIAFALTDAQIEAGFPDQIMSGMIDARGITTMSLPPGHYNVLAVEGANPWMLLGQPSVLKRLAENAGKVDLDDNGKGRISVALIKAADVKRVRAELQ